jgi:hypothetical protein
MVALLGRTRYYLLLLDMRCLEATPPVEVAAPCTRPLYALLGTIIGDHRPSSAWCMGGDGVCISQAWFVRV